MTKKSGNINITTYSLEDLQKLSKEELVDLAFKENQAKIEYWKKLNQNSNNSSRPPSTDSVGDKIDRSDREVIEENTKKRKKSKKKSGGQVGHPGTTLTKFTPDKINKIIKIFRYNPRKKSGEIISACHSNRH